VSERYLGTDQSLTAAVKMPWDSILSSRPAIFILISSSGLLL
jgi:hypothetical protein